MGINPRSVRRATLGIGVSLLIAFILIMMAASALIAAPLAANLDGSTKTVNRSQAFPGETLHYTVVISNSGDTAVSNVLMTDTLPASLTYQPGSLTYTLNSAAVTTFGESAGIISWTGVVSDLGSVAIYYSAVLTDNLTAGNEILNAVSITGTGALITRTAATAIITSANVYLPIIFKPAPAPEITSITEPDGANQWTVSWTDINLSGAAYELQEDTNTSFTAPTTIDNGVNLSYAISHTASANNYFCYRVRAKVNSLFSEWSNVQCAYGNYSDNFSDNSSGWAIRRQDTDDTNNSSYYKNGTFTVKIGGRWDYALASPVVQAPAGSYKIEGLVKLTDGIDNLQTYGIVFGADGNGQPCPNSDYSSCFNHYYRLQVIWYGSPDKLRVDLKRIDYHDSNNIGRGTVKLFNFRDVTVGDANGYNKWTIEVSATGAINVYVNDNFVGGGVDATHASDRYFGMYAASNEYSGTAAQFDWFTVTAMP